MTKQPEPTAPLRTVCSNCGAPRVNGAAFCEVCGLDFATGKLPAAPSPPEPASELPAVDWIVVVSVDAQFFETNQPDGTTLTLPTGVSEYEVPLRTDEILIGRRSASANVHPDIDLSVDPGVSRRHAVLKRRDDDTWVVIDQGSTNGTVVEGSAVKPGEERPVRDGGKVHVGAWTRLTLKRASG